MRARLDAIPVRTRRRNFNSKEKGSQWERTICRDLSQWISDGKRYDVFWRSAMSGGRATVQLAHGYKLKAQAGDISSIASLGERLLDHFIIESKFYSDLQIPQLVLKDAGFLTVFWNELRAKALVYGKSPILIGKQNNYPALCMMTGDALDAFSLSEANTVAHFPRLGAHVVLFDVFLREAQVPEPDVHIIPLRPKRIRL
jgi:hypothetical protein